jgi:hypothetical protein
MRGSFFVLAAAVLGLSTVAATSHASSLLETIDQAHRAGQINDAERIFYRVAAVKRPELLPAPWQELGRANGLGVRCGTPVLAEAFQSLSRLEPGLRGKVRDLLQPPADLAYMVEALTPYPVRVSYGDPSLQAKAEQVLAAAEYSYQKQVVEFGYWAPPIEPGTEPYRMRIDAMPDGAAAYTSPYAENEATSWADAFTYIVVGDFNEGDQLDTAVAHEFAHACQAGMDAAEVVGFWENTATTVESQVYPANWYFTMSTFPYFQVQPWRPLEYMNMGNSDLYEYGGALWAVFLTRTYGNDQPQFLRQVWEGSVQDGWENEPDYFDVIDTMTSAQGGIVEATKAFSEARFFVGAYDDGQHLADAGSWYDAEPVISSSWTTASLPLRDQGPISADTRPQPNGCNYVLLDVTTTRPDPLKFSFAGKASIPWDVRVFRLGGQAGTISVTLDVDAAGAGAISASLDNAKSFMLMVCQRPDASYDPDAQAWTAGDYRYSIDWDRPPPTVTSVEPAEVERGSHDVALVVHGTGFVDGTGLAVGVSGTRIHLELSDVVSETELAVIAVVAPDAELGLRDITVTNPNGEQAVGTGLLTVLEANALRASGPATDDSGCGCRLAGPSRNVWPSLLGLSVAALAGFRARRSGAARRRRAGS